MSVNEKEQNVRFSYFFPYGFTSQYALELSFPFAKTDPSCILYDPVIPMSDRLLMLRNEQRKRQKIIRYLEDYGYVEVTQISYSDTGWSELRIHRLTKAGLNFVTGSPDSPPEIKRKQILKEAGKRRIKRLTFSPDDEDYTFIRNTLYRMAEDKANSIPTQNAFDAFFLESFQAGSLTLLAREPVLAETVSVIPSLKASQIYTAWKLQNIEAMFRANKFLTSLDRRQIEIPRNKTALEKKEDNGKMDTYAFTKFVLGQWYAKNPASYLFQNPLPGTVSEEYWRKLPTFYSLRDLPGFESILDEEISGKEGESMNSGGANFLMRHSSLGLAIGDISNYLVYHTTQKGHLWSINIERNVIAATQRLVNIAGEATPVTGANRTIRSAIIMCPTVHQFARLFDKKPVAPSKWRKYSRVDAPFNSACIVPINRSGAMQLNLLMKSDPVRLEQHFITQFSKEIGFTKRLPTNNEAESIFKLNFNGIPVLLAPLLDYQQLYWAKQHYDNGRRFYVICFPEQVKFIKKIMPEIEFL